MRPARFFPKNLIPVGNAPDVVSRVEAENKKAGADPGFFGKLRSDLRGKIATKQIG
jgi:hypothetical protein